MNYFFEEAIIRPFTISLKYPLTIGANKLNFKKGYYLILRDNHHNYGMGELPFFSEDLQSNDEKNLETLREIIPTILNRQLDIKALNFKKKAFNLVEINEEGTPLFCLESAVLSWLEKIENNLIGDFFIGPNKQSKIPVNALYTPSEKNFPKDLVIRWKEKGFKTIKIKIGNLPLNAELDFIWKIHREAQGNFKIRLDGNQKFNGESLSFFAKNLPSDFVDYIEDPTKEINILEDIYKETKISFAFEETLLKGNFSCQKYLKAWVIKPSIVGGISKTIQLIDQARKCGLMVVISSAYESKITLKLLSYLASYQNRFKKTECGLYTFENFIDDDSLANIRVVDGNLSFY